MKDYTFEKFDQDLNNGYKICFTYLKNKYMIYKVIVRTAQQKPSTRKSNDNI